MIIDDFVLKPLRAPADEDLHEVTTDFGRVGRAAAMADPTGASFVVCKGANGDPPDAEKTPMGGWAWNELWTSDDRKAPA